MRKLPPTAAEDLLEIVMRRYERAAATMAWRVATALRTATAWRAVWSAGLAMAVRLAGQRDASRFERGLCPRNYC
jgi:hypothetical protein